MPEKPQPTPGPWTVTGATCVWSRGKGFIAMACDPEMKPGCTSSDFKPANSGTDRLDEAAANAQLIAAAPDLLAALKDCVLVMENDLNGLAVIQPELRIAKAAIAKAEGRTP